VQTAFEMSVNVGLQEAIRGPMPHPRLPDKYVLIQERKRLYEPARLMQVWTWLRQLQVLASMGESLMISAFLER
jgi:hypothetical protein